MNGSRRRFLVRSGWVAGGLTTIGVSGCSLLPALPTFGESTAADAWTWVQLRPDGSVRFLLPRAELGQGISTGLSQVVAEELRLPLAAIDCHYQDTGLMAPCQMTVGSQSMENYLTLTARSAACLRETLRQRAAQRFDIDLRQVGTGPEGGFVLPSGLPIRYQQLLWAGESSVATVPQDDALELLSERRADELSIVGRPAEPVHVRRIVTGTETFSRDVRLPHLHYGAIARPPQLGVKATGWDRTAALAIDGVRAVVALDDQLGVVGTTPMAARRGLGALKVTWATLAPEALANVQQPLDIDHFIDRDALDHSGDSTGTLATGAKNAAQTFSLRYDSPMVAHAALEPRAGVARWTTDDAGRSSCELWTGSQDPWMVRAAAAKALGISPNQVVVHNQRVGGAFGGRVLCQATIEAAWLSKATGVPVKVQWSREEEFRYNYVGPQFSTRIDAGLDESGRLTHWHHQAVGAPVLTSSTFIPPYLHWLANRVPDPGTKRGMRSPYSIKHQRLDFADERVPMPTGPWRGLGAAPNTFAVECAIDELASAARQDPIEFRLHHLDQPRLATCLQRLKQRIGSCGQPVGIAATSYKGVTHLAIAAEVAVVGDRFQVTRLVCVHDCGRVIAPDRVRAQIEGNLIWGIGMALLERFKLENGIAATDNFDGYALARNADVPDLEIELVRSDAAPSGAAEAAFAPAAAAIVNAVHAATGRRYRRLPLKATV
ncbi:MAG: molybdopterin cofactor-binding domain-containing protein [Pseudomonadota bacterium]